jgi:hypothetical protein
MDAENTFLIRGVDFAPIGFPRPFTMDERTLMQGVYETTGVLGAQQEVLDRTLTGATKSDRKSKDQLEKRFSAALLKKNLDVEKIEKIIPRMVALGGFDSDYRGEIVAALDMLLAEEYAVEEVEDWDDERIDALSAALSRQEALRADAQAVDLAAKLKAAEEHQAAMEGVLQVMDVANLQVAYEIGRFHHLKVNGRKEWMRDPTEDDLSAADALVVEGKRYASLERRMRSQGSDPKPAASASALTQLVAALATT